MDVSAELVEDIHECRRCSCLLRLDLVEDVEVEIDDATRDHLHVGLHHTNHLLELLKMLSRMIRRADVAHILQAQNFAYGENASFAKLPRK